MEQLMWQHRLKCHRTTLVRPTTVTRTIPKLWLTMVSLRLKIVCNPKLIEAIGLGRLSDLFPIVATIRMIFKKYDFESRAVCQDSAYVFHLSIPT
ncbi:hypothetical protein J6590_065509, partial [Homalodisca vitripennis]